MELVNRRVKTDKLVIAPLGDIQYDGSRGSTALEHLKRFIDRALEHEALFVGMGDYIDFASPTGRQKLRSAGLHENAYDVIESKALELAYELNEKVLAPTKGRWLGMLEGHHYMNLRAGDTTDMRLCQLLDTRFLGSSALIHLTLGTSTHKIPFTLWASHGQRGSGALQGTALHEIQQIAGGCEGVDVYMMGHVPKATVGVVNRLVPKWSAKPDLQHRSLYLVRTGGFSKAYVVNAREGSVPRGLYPEVKGYTPGYIGGTLITLRVTGDRERQINVEV